MPFNLKDDQNSQWPFDKCCVDLKDGWYFYQMSMFQNVPIM